VLVHSMGSNPVRVFTSLMSLPFMDV
jgi:hypothetical protein